MRPRRRETAVAKRIRERIEEIEVAKHVYETPSPKTLGNLSFEERMKRKVSEGRSGKKQKPLDSSSNARDVSDLSSEEIVEAPTSEDLSPPKKPLDTASCLDRAPPSAQGKISPSEKINSQEKMKCGCHTHRPQKTK